MPEAANLDWLPQAIKRVKISLLLVLKASEFSVRKQ
jgi:hypothetical protein